MGCKGERGEREGGGSHEHLAHFQWQEWDWVQLLGRFGDILSVKDVSVIKDYERARNTYITLDAHSTSRGAIPKVSIVAECVCGDIPNVRAVNLWTVFDHA